MRAHRREVQVALALVGLLLLPLAMRHSARGQVSSTPLCIQLTADVGMLSNASQPPDIPVNVIIYAKNSQNVLTKLYETSMTANQARVSLNDSSLLSAISAQPAGSTLHTYTKARLHLPINTEILAGAACNSLNVIPGTLLQDDRITISDLLAIIKVIRGETNPLVTEVFGKPNIASLVTAIRGSREGPVPPPEFAADLDALAEEARQRCITEDDDRPLGIHGDSPDKREEHFAARQLVQCKNATHIARKSGNWSDPQTWKDLKIPTANANVWIPHGTTVMIDGVLDSVKIKTIRIAGTLQFAIDRNTALAVDTIVVDPQGTYLQGTEQNPVPAQFTSKVTFTDNGPIDRVWDPYALSRGLVSHGTARIYGSRKTSFVPMVGHPDKTGITQITVQSMPSDWKVGDEIAITILSLANGDQPAKRGIAAINGNVITLSSPLTYAYRTVPQNCNQCKSYVANLTRNVVFQSENSTDFNRWGHVMFMHSPDAHVAYARFLRMGRTDKTTNVLNDPVVVNGVLVPGTGTNARGRYAIHFHRTGTKKTLIPSTAKGNVVENNPGWGIVNHQGYINVEDNVGYLIGGAFLVGEVGEEIGVFKHNIGMGFKGNGQVWYLDFARKASGAVNAELQDYGRGGSMVFQIAGGIDVIDNVASGFPGAAYRLYSYGYIQDGAEVKFPTENLKPEFQYLAKGQSTIDVAKVPFYHSGNEAIGGRVGFLMKAHEGGINNLIDTANFWNIVLGVGDEYSPGFTLRNTSILCSTQIDSGGVHIDWSADRRYENLFISGCKSGIELSQKGTTVVKDVRFNNVVRSLILLRMEGETWNANLRTIDISNMSFENRPAKPEAFDIGMASSTNPTEDQVAIANWIRGLIYRRGWAFFQPDRITFNGRLLYLNEQRPDFVYPAVPELPVQLHNKTVQQVWNEYHMAPRDMVMPPDATDLPGIVAPGLKFGPIVPLRSLTRQRTDCCKPAMSVADTSDKIIKSFTVVPGWNLLPFIDREGNPRTDVGWYVAK